MWDEVYSAKEYVYGTTPNDFLKESVDKLRKGKVLCIADGEGRNSVFLATLGFDVTAVDSSVVGLKKAEALAKENGVSITTIHTDLSDFKITANSWDSIVSIFCHLPPPLRKKVHKDVVNGLVDGGTFLLEAYTPKQLDFGTGGPPVMSLMMSLDELMQELSGLEFEVGQELERTVVEGTKHNGQAAVVQVVGKK